MKYTPKIEKAIQKASSLHQNQVRKGGNKLPYITHLFSVFVILSEYTQDEDILIAGLLHDTLEDTPYTADELEKDFGSRIREIVEGVSEQKTKNGEKIDWVDRKKEYIIGLKAGTEDSLLVSAADKIHNFNSALDAYSDNIEAFKKDFASEDRILFYSTIVDVITERLGKDHLLVVKLQEAFNNYKTFLEKVYTDTTPN